MGGLLMMLLLLLLLLLLFSATKLHSFSSLSSVDRVDCVCSLLRPSKWFRVLRWCVSHHAYTLRLLPSSTLSFSLILSLYFKTISCFVWMTLCHICYNNTVDDGGSTESEPYALSLSMCTIFIVVDGVQFYHLFHFLY